MNFEKYLKQYFLTNRKWKVSTTLLSEVHLSLMQWLKQYKLKSSSGFFSPVNLCHSIITPHSSTAIYKSHLLCEWKNEKIRVFSQRGKNKYWLILFFDSAWPILIFFPPWYLFHFQAYLPLTFWITLLDAFYQSLVCFFVPYYVSPCSLKGFAVNELMMFLCTL